jgi:hypothetical protein
MARGQRRSCLKGAVVALLVSSMEVHGFVATQRAHTFHQSRISSSAPSAHRSTVIASAAPTSRAGALSTLISGAALVGAAGAAVAAPPSPWGLSEFLTKVDKDEVEKVIFGENGKELLALDSDGDRHSVEILPAEVRHPCNLIIVILGRSYITNLRDPAVATILGA